MRRGIDWNLAGSLAVIASLIISLFVLAGSLWLLEEQESLTVTITTNNETTKVGPGESATCALDDGRYVCKKTEIR